jgi:hypothetical protein
VSKRRYRPVWVERDAALNALGLLGKSIHYDHRPPLSHRYQDPVTGLYEPDENDPRYLYPVLAEVNKALADGDCRPLSGDTSVAAKLKRNAKAEEEFRARILAKEPGEPRQRKSRIPSRPFQRKGKKK